MQISTSQVIQTCLATWLNEQQATPGYKSAKARPAVRTIERNQVWFAYAQYLHEKYGGTNNNLFYGYTITAGEPDILLQVTKDWFANASPSAESRFLHMVVKACDYPMDTEVRNGVLERLLAGDLSNVVYEMSATIRRQYAP